MDLPVLVGVVVGAVVTIGITALSVRRLSKAQGDLGINLSRAKCPKCGEPSPIARRPKNWRQFMWGGWTCAKCGTESDKWGKRV